MTSRLVTTVDELKGIIGEETSCGEWTVITQARIDQFAEATGDHQWIHVDPERAKTTPFGGTIAHGALTLSMIGTLSRSDAPRIELKLPMRMSINYGLNRVRYTSPVRVGKRIRARRTLLGVEEVAPKVVQLTNQVTVEIEGEGKPALVAEVLHRWYLD